MTLYKTNEFSAAQHGIGPQSSDAALVQTLTQPTSYTSGM
jgi:hypothetical protein